MADQAEYMVDNLDRIMSELAPIIERACELAMQASVDVLAKPRPLVPGRLKEPLFARQKVLGAKCQMPLTS